MSGKLKLVLALGVAAVLIVVFVASIASRDMNMVRVSTAKVGRSDLVSSVSCNGGIEAKISPEQELQKAKQAFDVATANEQLTERRIEQARAQLAGSRDSLTKTTLTAPIAGVVTARPVEAGENAMIGTMNNPGTVLLTI